MSFIIFSAQLHKKMAMDKMLYYLNRIYIAKKENKMI